MPDVTVAWTPLHAEVHQVLRSRTLLPQNQQILIGVSGGQDSLCLARLLLDLQPKWGWGLAIACLDHRWRADSAANTDHVRTLAQSWKVPFYTRQAENLPLGEAAARQWRYAVLEEIAQTAGFGTIVTGHTASDRAETLLYNLVRGSGADGLQALVWRRVLPSGIELVRPLLGLTRKQTGQFCQLRRLPVWEDSTNINLHYARNRMRQVVLPYLCQHFNPQAEQHLAQTAELLQAEVEWLEELATGARQQAQHPIAPGLNRPYLRGQAIALQRRVIRQFLRVYLPNSPNFDQIEKLLTLVTAPNRSCTDPFPGGAIAQVDGDWIWLRLP